MVLDHASSEIAFDAREGMDREDQKAQGERVERLWRMLDMNKQGRLDLNDLKNGLSHMDHRTLPTKSCSCQLTLGSTTRFRVSTTGRHECC